MKKFDYDPMHQYVEKERTRSLLIEASSGPTAGEMWRRVFLVLFLGMLGGIYYFATQTPRGRYLVTAITKDPMAAQRASRRAARQAAAQAAEQAEASAQSTAAGAGSGGSGDPDDMQEMENLRKSQEAMGHQLEAFAEGKAPPPSPEAVRAAMTGQAPPPVIAPPPAAAPATPPVAASSSTVAAPAAPPPREPASVMVPATLDRLAGTPATAPAPPPYQTISRIPPAYAQELQEFPDLK